MHNLLSLGRLLRRKVHLLALALLVSIFVGSVYVSHHHFPSFPLHHVGKAPTVEQEPNNASASPSPVSVEAPSGGNALTEDVVAIHLDQILGDRQTPLPTLACPAFSGERYASLKADGPGLRYYFALDLRNSLSILPQLLGSIVEAIKFLGSTSCALSIVEGNSNDGTPDVLSALRPQLEMRGIRYFLQASSIDPSNGDRIPKLAQLRNLALEPLLQRWNQVKPSSETAIIFVNDVVLCPDDILELVLQRGRLNATMTCAMDWTYVGHDPTFYDVWVARTIQGDSFFDIPADGNWNSAWNLLWNADEDIRSRFYSNRPFPVFSCWNGAVVFGATVVLEHGLRFRGAKADSGECTQGEPQLFCKDLWFRGLGKIAVVPTVNLEYSVERGRQIKAAKGFTVANVAAAAGNVDEDDTITWRPPPDMVKCMPTWDNQFWQSWNETLA
ncbi:hypothetical protein JDV02_008093 [Purpureocillium takamizusanense]|uniref:Alpha-1,3-mannosyltransferase CMT1 n=1 Tax=Purpureocillium takamizusanense TaxID=2060973 RepID=A0A9Q8QMZ2_9HYPO|nr:uncharacterized protein JDV02_008093 [Purpureocillium takamizusanense]UNI22182.1 hypothetical protein JDV02_008093 [Purpureocillium takamizusanense]